MTLSPLDKERLAAALAANGQRLTRQRELVYAVVLAERDHPTAEVILERAQRTMPSLSMATVYNCVEMLVHCGLLRQVNLERHATRYCPFKEESPEHAHFFCTDSGRVVDIDLTADATRALKNLLPAGFEAESVELCFRGKAAASAS